MTADPTPEEPYVHPYALGTRVEDLVQILRDQKAGMESGSAMAAVSYTLTVELLLDIMPHLLKEHRRMAYAVSRDPMACTATYLSCDRHAEPYHDEHYDRYAGVRWTRNARDSSITMEH